MTTLPATPRESEFLVQIHQNGTLSIVACEFDDDTGDCSLDQLQKLVQGDIELINPSWIGLSPRAAGGKHRHKNCSFCVIANENGMDTLEHNEMFPGLFGNILIGISRNGDIRGFKQEHALKLMQDIKTQYND